MCCEEGTFIGWITEQSTKNWSHFYSPVVSNTSYTPKFGDSVRINCFDRKTQTRYGSRKNNILGSILKFYKKQKKKKKKKKKQM
jgi:hypothetical protein